jgi:hypothetical protein
MASTRIGKQSPRYSFMLNPRAEVRLSKGPKCQKRTHPRKFVLFIHVDGWGSMALGKTCLYCSACELIMAHQDELEAELAHSFGRIAPGMVGNEYVVLGTIDKKVWRAGLEGRGKNFEILKHVADFEKEYDLVYEPGGRYPTDEG